MARTSWSTSTARSCSERLPHTPRSVRLASRRSLCARQCSRVGDFRHFVTAITGGGWVLCEVKALSHGTKGQSNGYHRFGYCRRDRIRRLVGLYGYAVEAWEGGCACGVGSDLTACDYVALASRRNTGRILLSDIAASELLVIALPAPPGCDGDHIAPDTVRANVPWRWSQSEGFGQCSLLERLQSSPR
jgi:hypothetical protein